MKTLSEYHRDFIEHQRLIGRSPTYIRSLVYCPRRLIAWLGSIHGVATPDKLTSQHLEAWGHQVSTHLTTKGLVLRPKSISKQIESDRVFILWMAEIGAVPGSLAAALPKIKLPSVLPTSVLTHRQMVRLLKAVNTTTPEGFLLRAMLEFMYSSGVRVAELLDLDIEHVDLPNHQALIRGKGGKERMVPFGDTAARYIESYFKAFRPLTQRSPGEKALWLDRSGERMPYHTFRRQLIEVADRACLSVHVTAHTFRRSFTTELIRNGANLWHVKEALGHESVETLTPYTKLTIPDLRKTHARCHPREKDSR